VQYLTKTHGEKSIGKMLAAFQEGLDTGPALQKACGVAKEDFEKGYRAFLAQKVKNLPARPARKEMTLKQLRDAHAKNPDDLAIAGQLAEKNYELGKKREAKELADKIRDKEPRNPTAVYVKARLLIDEGKADLAVTILEGIANNDLKDTKPLKLLALLQYNSMKFPQAAKTCELARTIDPHDPYWIKELQKVYIKTQDKDKLVEIFEEVARIDPDDFLPRKTLAIRNHDMGKNMEAEKYARMALEIDVTDRECQRILVESLTALNRQEEADRLRKVFGP
jgi:tetratricopeptide (TPR) repeat protein